MKKVVRSRIPEIMTVQAGQFDTPTDYELGDLLRRKLMEEVAEYLEAHDPSELVDIIEVCYALGENAGIPRDALDIMGADKTARRGDLRPPGVVWTVGE